MINVSVFNISHVNISALSLLLVWRCTLIQHGFLCASNIYLNFNWFIWIFMSGRWYRDDKSWFGVFFFPLYSSEDCLLFSALHDLCRYSQSLLGSAGCDQICWRRSPLGRSTASLCWVGGRGGWVPREPRLSPFVAVGRMVFRLCEPENFGKQQQQKKTT